MTCGVTATEYQVLRSWIQGGVLSCQIQANTMSNSLAFMDRVSAIHPLAVENRQVELSGTTYDRLEQRMKFVSAKVQLQARCPVAEPISYLCNSSSGSHPGSTNGADLVSFP